MDNLRVDEPPSRWNYPLDTAVVATVRDVLPQPVITWALVTADQVIDEVEELRRSGSIVSRSETREVERLACVAGMLTTLASLRSGTPVEQVPDEIRHQVRAAFRFALDY